MTDGPFQAVALGLLWVIAMANIQSCTDARETTQIMRDAQLEAFRINLKLDRANDTLNDIRRENSREP